MRNFVRDIYICLIHGGRCDRGEAFALVAEIKKLERDYKDHTEILGDKLNDQIEYSKQDREKIEKLQAVCEAANSVNINALIDDLDNKYTREVIPTEALDDYIKTLKVLQQALAVKEK